MTAVALLDAERIKLSTTRSPVWTAVGVAGLSLGLAAIQGSTAYGAGSLPAEKPALGVAVFGVPVLMVLAAMTVTGEYRSGMICTMFMATPNRSMVLVAKAVVASVFSGAYTALMVIGAVLAARGRPRRLLAPNRSCRWPQPRPGAPSAPSRSTECSRRCWVWG